MVMTKTSRRYAEGHEFPEEKAPDYLDFAYFSFVIGMTFQVSDVVITSRDIRRQVLVHGLLAFALNTFVVALTVTWWRAKGVIREFGTWDWALGLLPRW